MTPDLTPDTMLRLILTSRVYDVARETPLDPAPRLSRRLGNDVLLKREDLQPVFSFKMRGAYNRIAHLSEAERARGRDRGQRRQPRAGRGVRRPPSRPPRADRHAADDAGDQGRGGARARRRGRAVRRQLRRGEGTLRRAASRRPARVFVHPFDDPLVIAGQGTIGDEMLRHSAGDVSAIFVPVGGGGLIAGIASYVKALRPEVRVIGVEPFEADAMYQSLEAGRRVALDRVGIFADGVAVREVGAPDVPDRAGDGRRDRPRLERRDLRGDQGHLRRHALDHGAGRRAGGRRAAYLGRARPGHRRAPGSRS